MSLSTLKVFNGWAYSVFLELLNHNIQLFNEATRGGLVLRNGATNQGDYSEEALYARIPGLVRRRNAYGTGAVSEVEISQLLDRSVKVAAGTPPVVITPHFWQWIQRSPEEAGAVIGKQLAEETLADMLAVSVKSLVAALNTVGASVVYDGTAGVASLASLLAGARKFGDRAGSIACWLIHSQPLHDLWNTNLANAAQLFQFGDVRIMEDGFGRRFVMTDQPDLVYSDSGTKYRTLGLVSGATVVQQNNDFVDNIETKNGDENITRTYQAQWTYNVGLKGFAWDKDNGGHSPSNAALATGTNWDKYATEIKDIAGVLVKSQ